MPTQPAAAGRAKLWRPARRDWIVVGSGAIDVPDLSLRDEGGTISECAALGIGPTFANRRQMWATRRVHREKRRTMTTLRKGQKTKPTTDLHGSGDGFRPPPLRDF